LSKSAHKQPKGKEHYRVPDTKKERKIGDDAKGED